MTKFEKMGCILQLSAKTIEEATSRHEHSCMICSCRNLNGGHCKDEDCPITVSYKLTVAALSK